MNVLLRILSWLYGIGVGCRNMLYNAHVFPSREAALPTICVGNLAVGGTGKTPMVEYLVRLLTENGFSVAVLSRGYRRKSVGFVEAEPGATAARVGDEAAQLKRKFPQLTVAVCEDRWVGVRRLKRRHPHLQCVLLDDAFQHRQLKPGYSVLLTQADRLYVEDQLLPLGRLREPAEGCYRANMVVVTKCPPAMQPIDQRVIDNKLHLPAFMPLVFTYVAYKPLEPVFTDGDTLSVDDLKDKRVLLLTGIAQPHYLYDYLKPQVAHLAHLSYADHHDFTAADVNHIEEVCSEERCNLILTTEKDAVRLRSLKRIPNNWKSIVYFQPIEVKFMRDDRETFDKNILSYVRKSTENR